MKKILVISFSKIHQDGRVLRQIKSLSKNYNFVTAIGYSNPNIDQVEFWEVPQIEIRVVKKLFFLILLKFKFFNIYSRIEPRFINVVS